MARFMTWMPQADYGQQWAVTFGAGCFTWFILICFAKLLPPSIQLLTFLLPILCFIHALHILPKWQKEGRRQELTESLIEREISHSMMNRHHRNLATMDLDHNQQMQELATSIRSSPQRGVQPLTLNLHRQNKPPILLKLKQDVMQACGDIGWLCVEYLSGQGAQYGDPEGWIAVEKLRSNWAKKYGLNTEQVRQLLTALTGIQAGEWRNSDQKEWRLLLTL
jgi:hypothetical protein